MGAKGSHMGRMEAQLEVWGRKLDEYAATEDRAGIETKAELGKRVQELKATYRAAKTRLVQLRSEGNDRRDLVMHGLQHAWTEAETTIKQLGS